MTGHFDQHLKLRELILEKHPKLIVEVGAGDGDNTKLLAHLHAQYPFRLVSISDKKIGVDGVEFVEGISYEKLKDFSEGEIDLCIIDTDHNYWTLAKELEAVHPKMKMGGLIVFHDVDEFYYNSGIAGSYWDDHVYPEKEIRECVKFGGTGLALIDWLHAMRGYYKLLWWTPMNYGAAVIERVSVENTLIIMPGSAPQFAKPV